MINDEGTFTDTVRQWPEEMKKKHGACVARKGMEVAVVPMEGAGFRVLQAMAR
jgi:hypothetical protein